MFDEKDLAQYRSVLPSDEVKDAILADLDQGINGKKTGKINLSRAFPLIAACLVLVLSAVFLFGTAQSSLLLESQEGVTSARSIGETVTAKAEMKLQWRSIFTTGVKIWAFMYGKMNITT